MILKKLNKKFTCYFAYSKEFGENKDILFVKEISKKYGFDLKVVEVNKKETEKAIKHLVEKIESSNAIKIEIGRASCRERV